MQRGEIEGVKGRGQTAAEEAKGEEKTSEWEISPTLEERPVLSSKNEWKRVKKREEKKKKRANKEWVMEKGARYGRWSNGESSAGFPLYWWQIITEFIWLQVSHWKTWVFISVQPDTSITKPAGIWFTIKNKSHVRLNVSHLTQQQCSSTPSRNFATGEKKEVEILNKRFCLVVGGDLPRRKKLCQAYIFLRRVAEKNISPLGFSETLYTCINICTYILHIIYLAYIHMTKPCTGELIDITWHRRILMNDATCHFHNEKCLPRWRLDLLAAMLFLTSPTLIPGWCHSTTWGMTAQLI